jgi:ketosteroid isomerase-like protein
MTRAYLVVLAAALATHVGLAQTPAPSVEQELLKLERAGTDLMIKKDRAGLEQLNADDYIYTHSNGSVMNKAQDIAEIMGSDQKWTSGTVTDTKVRVYGDFAVVIGLNSLQGAAKGYKPGARRFTDTFVKRNGRWQMLGGASTIVTTTSAPANNTTALSAVKDLKAKALTPKTADERAIVAAEQNFAQTELANDEAKSRAIQTKDYSFVSRSGALVSPSDPPGPQIKSIVMAYDHLQSAGTAVVLHGSMLWTDSTGFSPGVLRFMRIWVKQGNEWKLAAEQRTPLAAAPRSTSH